VNPVENLESPSKVSKQMQTTENHRKNVYLLKSHEQHSIIIVVHQALVHHSEAFKLKVLINVFIRFKQLFLNIFPSILLFNYNSTPMVK
jgi:hypothetical protein